jgi:hypothetical protein
MTWYLVVFFVTWDMQLGTYVHWTAAGDGGTYEECQEWKRREVERERRIVSAWCENTEQAMHHRMIR